jgi:hypothetical protein
MSHRAITMNAEGGSGNGFCFPYNVLLDILRRLPTYALARSRCVCRVWRAIVKAHKLILPLPLPLPYYFPRRSFPGIFFSKDGFDSTTSFFASPGSERLFYPHEATVLQSCNGLLLIEDEDGDTYVLNPATARSARLRAQSHGGPPLCHSPLTRPCRSTMMCSSFTRRI